MKTRTLEESIQKLQRHLARKFPGLEFDVEIASAKEGTIYFGERESEDWYDVIEAAGGLAVDILVDYGHWIHVQPKFSHAVS